jgi:hypothetical protein
VSEFRQAEANLNLMPCSHCPRGGSLAIIGHDIIAKAASNCPSKWLPGPGSKKREHYIAIIPKINNGSVHFPCHYFNDQPELKKA